MDEKTKRTLIRSGVGIFTVGAGTWLAHRKMPLIAAGLVIWFLPNIVYRYNRAVWETSGYYQAQKQISDLKSAASLQLEIDNSRIENLQKEKDATIQRENLKEELVGNLQSDLQKCQAQKAKVETKTIMLPGPTVFVHDKIEVPTEKVVYKDKLIYEECPKVEVRKPAALVWRGLQAYCGDNIVGYLDKGIGDNGYVPMRADGVCLNCAYQPLAVAAQAMQRLCSN